MSVREAGLTMLVPHARLREELALEYYDALVRATKGAWGQERWAGAAPAGSGSVPCRRSASRPHTLSTHSTADVGVSVRKVGVRALADCFLLRDPASARAMETARHVLLRAGDAEASVRETVARTFHALWFAEGAPAPEGVGEGCGRPLQQMTTERVLEP